MNNNKKINRRRFLKTCALTSGAVAFPSIIPSSALGKAGTVAPSNRITMGCIGVGGQGIYVMKGFLSYDDVQVVAVCDVSASCDYRSFYWGWPDAGREPARQMVDDYYAGKNRAGAKCSAYVDFRELLARDDIDTVSICTPDHWHGLISIAAAKAGKDVYCEKPLARSIQEGRAIVNAVKRYGRIWQTGSQQRSQKNFRHACELVRNGRIGKIHRVEVGLPSGDKKNLGQTVLPVPEGLDWDFWLGPAPWRPFCEFGKAKCHFNWRWIMDYSGGQLTDWAGHHIDIAHWGLGLEHTGPAEIEGKGEYPEEGLYNTPISYKITCKYSNGVEIVIGDEKYFPNGTKWYGENGWIFVSREMFKSKPQNLVRDEIGPKEIRLYESNDHIRDFLNCVRSRRQAIAPAEVAHRSISVALLGEIAMLTGRKIRWNPEKEEIIDDPAASRLLGRSYREPWSL